MSREKSPPRLGAEIFSRHSAPMIERALSIREWSSSGLVCRFVSACEAENCFLFPVVPFPCRDGAIRFLKPTSLPFIPSKGANPWSYLSLLAYAFLGLPKRALVPTETRVFTHGPDL